MPSDACNRRLPRRRDVLDKGWHRKGEGLLPTMMRLRQTGKGCIVFSAYLYAPQHLLHDDRWNGIGLAE
eukprot:15443074-Alexandrium_andersonii.AAC.1